MSVSGISSSSLSDYNVQNSENLWQQIQQEFQQLGQDLQAGNLAAAQSDFAGLQQLMPNNSNSTAQSNNPVAQAFKQLAQDLQAGNLSAAQQDYTNLEQVFQNQAQASKTHGHHHHHGGASEISQLMDQLGQALQSGDLSTAQQLFTTLQQSFQQFAQTSGQLQPSSQSGSISVSVNA